MAARRGNGNMPYNNDNNDNENETETERLGTNSHAIEFDLAWIEPKGSKNFIKMRIASNAKFLFTKIPTSEGWRDISNIFDCLHAVNETQTDNPLCLRLCLCLFPTSCAFAQEHAGRGNARTQDLADSDDDDGVDDDDDDDDNDDYDIVGNIQSNAYDKQPKKIQQQQTPTSKDAVYI
ncbi:hypothetical protein ACLKA7_012348 [Drosophila subpalustris]